MKDKRTSTCILNKDILLDNEIQSIKTILFVKSEFNSSLYKEIY